MLEKIRKQKAEEYNQKYHSNAESTQPHLKRPQFVNNEEISLSQQSQINQSYQSKLNIQKPEIQNKLHLKPIITNIKEINESLQFINKQKAQLLTRLRLLTPQHEKKNERTLSKQRNNFLSTSQDDKRHSSLFDEIKSNTYSQIMNKFVAQPNNNLSLKDKQSRESFLKTKFKSPQKTMNQNITPIKSVIFNDLENNTSPALITQKDLQNLNEIRSTVQEKLLDFNLNQILIPSIPQRLDQQIKIPSQKKAISQNSAEKYQSPASSNQMKKKKLIQSPYQQLKETPPIPRKKGEFQQSNEKEDRQYTNSNQQISMKNVKKPYDTNCCLSLKVMSLNNHLQFKKKDQILPIMISIKADENFNINQDIKSTDSRPSLDLVCVIDHSSSMSGDKIKNVRIALHDLLELLTEKDRISLVLFSTYPILLCDLLIISPKNKHAVTEMINNIQAHESTNIELGMEMAFSVLAKRISFNQITSIFLLSDGQDGNADQRINHYLTKGNGKNLFRKGEIFTIHSFGFGSDHDGPLMKKISQLRDGYFYYVEDINQIDQYFVNSLGGLLSVTAQDISIDINLNKSDLSSMKHFQGAQITKTYGDMWKTVKKGESYKIEIAQLISGVSKDFIMEVTIPGNSKNLKLIDFERNFELVKVSMTAIPIDGLEIATKIAIEKNLVLTLFSQNEEVASNSEINDDVQLNYMRVKVATSIEEAMKFSESKNYEQGQEVLNHMISTIKSIPKKNNKMKFQSELYSLKFCKEKCRPQTYQEEGRQILFREVSNGYSQTPIFNEFEESSKTDNNRCSIRQSAFISAHISRQIPKQDPF